MRDPVRLILATTTDGVKVYINPDRIEAIAMKTYPRQAEVLMASGVVYTFTYNEIDEFLKAQAHG